MLLLYFSCKVFDSWSLSCDYDTGISVDAGYLKPCFLELVKNDGFLLGFEFDYEHAVRCFCMFLHKESSKMNDFQAILKS